MPELVVSNLCADGFGKARGTIVPGQRFKHAPCIHSFVRAEGAGAQDPQRRILPEQAVLEFQDR